MRTSIRQLYFVTILLTSTSMANSQTSIPEMTESLHKQDIESTLNDLDGFSNNVTTADTSGLYQLFAKMEKAIPHSELTSLIRYFNVASAICKKIGDDERYILFQSNLIEMHQIRKDHKKTYELTTALMRDMDLSPYYLMRMYHILGYYYREQSNYDSSMHYGHLGLALALEEGDTTMVPLQYITLAGIEGDLGNKYNAIDLSIAGIDACRPSQIYFKPGAYRQLAELFVSLKNYGKAKEYAQKSLEMGREMGSDRYVAYANISLGDVASHEGNLDMAEELYQAGHTYFVAQNNAIQVMSGSQLSDVAIRQGDLITARQLLTEVDASLDKNNSAYNNQRYYITASKLAIEEGNIASAVSFVTLADEQKIESPRTGALLDILDLKRRIAENRGHYKIANTLILEAHDLQDSVRTSHQSQLVHNLEAKFLKSEQDKEIAILSSKQEIAQASIDRRNRWLLLGGIGLVLLGILASIFYRLYKTNKNNKEKLAEQNVVIQTSLEEKSVLLQEIHHRVKNNLQVISSLLKLQTRFTEDETVLDAISAGRSRVQSMALLHQNLYQDKDLKGVRMKDYFENLAQNLFDTYHIGDGEIEFTHDIEDISLDIDTVIPIGLITNELISNALKHAFDEEVKNGDRELHVGMHKEKDLLVLEVSDNGKGLPNAKLEEKANSLGSKLIHSFAEKLNADIQVVVKDGTQIKLLIKDFQESNTRLSRE